ncbi:MAG: hypothetical protein IRY99_23870 [Isosphaeraceae bacterium]|nr:hypothetical protein [Isosphaeraceae bacterium]
MADGSRARLLLIVTGSSLRAEEVDRPLAYYLKQQVEGRLARLAGTGGALRVLVVADLRWLQDAALQGLPTISVGGPGVNLLARKWLEELPVSLAVEEHYFIQMDPELDEPRVSVWGMDNATTQIAVSAFIQRFLDRFLQHCAATASDAPAGSDDE